jgi:hypothetical protein
MTIVTTLSGLALGGGDSIRALADPAVTAAATAITAEATPALRRKPAINRTLVLSSAAATLYPRVKIRSPRGFLS